MRKLIVAIAAVGLAATANAGDYHKRESLRCSECHTMHASRAHDMQGAALTTDALPDPGNAHRKLLVNNGTNQTCLACHDGKSGVPDVVGAAAAGTSAATGTRSAGALNSLVVGHTDAAYSDYMGHTLGSANPPPGFVGVYAPTPVENFNCANCHAVHGSGAYRNLGLSSYMGLEGMAFDGTNPFTAVGPTYNPVDQVTGARAVTAFDPGRDVTITAAARSYTTATVQFGVGSANTTARNGMNAYCAVCHGNFHGDANTRDQIGGIDFIRHPTSAIPRAVGAGGNGLLLGTNTTALVRPAWTVDASGTGAFEAACLSCHKGHGNQQGYGLIYPNAAAANVDMENGDGLKTNVRSLCITCHPMGRF
jgi:hypothetical protein